MRPVCLIHAALLACLFAATYHTSTPDSPVSPRSGINTTAPNRAALVLQHVTVPFEANVGQADPGTRFLAQGQGCSVAVREDGLTLAVSPRQPEARWTRDTGPAAAVRRPAVVRMRLAGSDPSAPVLGEDPQGTTSHFYGRDSSAWRTTVPAFRRVRCAGIYPGIDAVYYGTPIGASGGLEYDLVVAPGALPGRIRIVFHDAGRKAYPQAIDRAGNLSVRTPAGELRCSRPVMYQQLDGRRQLVPGGYQLSADGAEASFRIGEYDRTRPLVIDPVVRYFTQPGSFCSDVAVDSEGFPYVAGSSYVEEELDLFVLNSFVMKFSRDGAQTLYTARFGGKGTDFVTGIAVDGAGSAYVTGMTDSLDFPTVTPFQAELGAGNLPNGVPHADAFVTKIAPDGGSLVYATYLGGRFDENRSAEGGIAVARDGSAVVVGETISRDFPVANAFQPKNAGPDIEYSDLSDAYVSMLDPSGTRLRFSTYLGGGSNDVATAVAVGPDQSVYLCGGTVSDDFPLRRPLQPARGEVFDTPDAWVVRMQADGSDLIYSTYLGGRTLDIAWGIGVDSGGSAYVAGETASANFPLAAPFQGTLNARNPLEDEDAFVTRIDPDGARLAYSTFLGGGSADAALAIHVTTEGSATVVGVTNSEDFPILDGAARDTGRFDLDGFLARVTPDGSALLYSTYLGTAAIEDVAAGAHTDSAGNHFVAGYGSPVDDVGEERMGFAPARMAGTSAPGPSRSGRAFLGRLRQTRRPRAGRLRILTRRLVLKQRTAEPDRRSVRLVNSGGGRLDGTVGTLAPPFSVVSGGGAFTLAAGQSRLVFVEFSATNARIYKAKLAVTLRRPYRQKATVPVQGRR